MAEPASKSSTSKLLNDKVKGTPPARDSEVAYRSVVVVRVCCVRVLAINLLEYLSEASLREIKRGNNGFGKPLAKSRGSVVLRRQGRG